MMLALAAQDRLPGVIVPGGVTLPPAKGEDTGKVQTIGARFSHGAITLEYAADMGCRACASPGGGCQFLGTAASSQVIAEALGMALPHSALVPSGDEDLDQPTVARLQESFTLFQAACQQLLTLPPVGADLFTDGFESGDPGRWSAVSG